MKTETETATVTGTGSATGATTHAAVDRFGCQEEACRQLIVSFTQKNVATIVSNGIKKQS